MQTKIIQFKEAHKFAKDNGYIYAVYEKKEVETIENGWNVKRKNYYLVSDCHLDNYEEYLDGSTPVIVKNCDNQLDFNEFITKDKKYCFRLHNNYNIPQFIPIFLTNKK